MAAHIKTPYLLSLARNSVDALRNDAHFRLFNESEADYQNRRDQIGAQSARVIEMLISELERVTDLNNQLGMMFETPKLAQSSFSSKRHNGNAPSN